METIQLIRGDDANLTITFTDENNEVIDLTGYTVFFNVKRIKDLDINDDTTSVISKTIVNIPNAQNGIVIINLSNSETDVMIGQYAWDLQLKNQTGEISSTQKGTLVILQDVSKNIV